MASESTHRQGGQRVVRIGKYEVVAHIATGGMAAVYKARNTEDGRDVALKVLPREMAAKPSMVERFKREARSAARLKHDNIVRILDSDVVGSTVYIAMEYVDGIDLHDHVKRNGPLDPEEARQLVLQGARALRHAHDNNIVHRDIKPSNFLLLRQSHRQTLKLTDFGLAREVDANEFRVTRAGTTVGTIDYISPEQARDSSLADIRSDLYSLGSTWYHLLTGHAPFPRGGLAERLVKLMNDDPPDIRDLNPRVSDDTWAILSKLLAKDPDDRYQTPADLIDDLLALEGKARARRATRRPNRAKKSRVRPAAESDTDDEVPATRSDGARHSGVRWVVIVGALLLLLGGAVLGLALHRRARNAEQAGEPSPSTVPQSDPAPGTGRVLRTVPGRDRARNPDKPTTPVPVRLPALYNPSDELDAAALRAAIDRPWKWPAPTDPFQVRVRRAPGGSPSTYPSLAAACAAAPAAKAIVIEIHDNGPLFESAVRVEGRDLIVRAGQGYRPLLIWDVPHTLALRKRNKVPETEPAELLSVKKGSLALEGLDVALRWPEWSATPAGLLDVWGGTVQARDCTFSVAGKHRDAVNLVRVAGMPCRCRLTRCHVRGGSVQALDMDTPGAEALIDGCLVVGGPPTLLRLTVDNKTPTRLAVVRSTLVCQKKLVELKPNAPLDRNPELEWLGWDALLSRSSQSEGGELLSVLDGAATAAMRWRAINCLYAGWQNLLAEPVSLGPELAPWQRHWKRIEGDGVARDPWPGQLFNEPATQSAATYTPEGGVAFRSSLDPTRPLGCDVAALPGERTWMTAALDPSVLTPETPRDSGAPEIPNPGDGKYHGERLDLTNLPDLGVYLAGVQKKQKLGPRVVLHLAGKGEHSTAPIKLEGATLVLYFEPPAQEGDPPLALKLGSGGETARAALIEVDHGGVEVISGALRLPESAGPRVTHLLKARGGDIRLYRCKLEGPLLSTAADFRALIGLDGSGEPAADRARGCAINECVLESGGAAVLLEGVGCRLLVKQSVVVSGSTAFHFAPARGYQGRAGQTCVLENVTVAARQAVARLGDVTVGNAEGGMGNQKPPSSLRIPEEPVVVQARDCAYLNPFPGLPSRAGMLLYEGDSLARGLLLWQGQREVYDPRLFFAAALHTRLPRVSEPLPTWAQLWGSMGLREPKLDLKPTKKFESRRWPLDCLKLPPGRGADLEVLGIGVKKKPAPG
jgi:serine/threonine protein kinase